ncbi:hypothetical protein Pth03_44100 [Planotetraspora thailandica]|uniref:Uncharacterized protein n=1 Tax=Planotetraspora thailandica TaxID=487172 RepID=A0A8J3V3C1_9ACTN|nr:hypothetical protein Pth03_44100 [Planotetraspora thailandica]
MGTKPGFQDIGGAAGQDVDAFACLGVDQHGGVAVAPAQGEVIHAEHTGHPRLGRRHAQQKAQCGVPGQADSQSG